MLTPVFVQNEKKFLGSPQSEYWKKSSAAAVEDIGDSFHELCFSLDTWRVHRDTKRRLGDKDIDLYARWYRR